MLKKMFYLTDDGAKSLKRAIRSVVVSNTILLFGVGMISQIVMTIVTPFTENKPIDFQRLWLLFALSIIVALVYLLAYRREYQRTYNAAYEEAEKIRVEVAEHMRKLPLSFFDNKDLSELTTNLMADCSVIEHAMSHIIPQLFGNMITVTMASAFLMFYEWRMALLVFSTLPVTIIVYLSSTRLRKAFGNKHIEAKLRVSGQIQEYLEGIKVVKAFKIEGEKSDALKSSLKNMMNQALIFEIIGGTFVTMSGIILQLGLGMVILIGLNLLMSGEISFIVYLTFLFVSLRIYAPIVAMLGQLPELSYLMLASKRMQILRQIPAMSGSDEVDIHTPKIVFEDVDFSYREEPFIKGLNLSIEAQGVTAFVGPSGSGKSTLSRLIARFYDVQGGRILIDGIDILKIEPEKLMSYMSFVFQDVVLFNDTIKNNIAIGKKDATEEEIIHAAKLARCDEFIKHMSNGYDTLVGENGSTLSGGERQRLSIARALLKDAPIILLDEATASLDPENEVLIQEAISELVKNKSVIVIAHRLRTVFDADHIVVLDEGRIVEEGTGPELLKKNGLFAKLYQIQKESMGWSV